MSDALTAAIVGAVTAIFTSGLATWIGYRSIRVEFRNKYHLEVITKQLQACESLWKVLSVASRSSGDERLIVIEEQGANISIENARKLYENLNDVFNSEAGLYFSKNLRYAIFKLRDYVNQEILLSSTEKIFLNLSKTKAQTLDGHVQNLRQAIRQEIGVEDLNLAKVNRPQ